ncbi:MAG: tetratricopeptide repeat protein [Chloroflexota bacterium]|nr:tetratricopeptide repeat protein [Chloroflexota bacterium]
MTSTEPTPEFEARAKDIHRRWESGELPFQAALEGMSILAREAESSGLPANQGRVELLLGVMQGYRANLDASIRHFERARDLFERSKNRKRAIGAILNLGESYRLKGDFTRARQLFHTAYEGAESIGALSTQAMAACNEGLMLVSMGRWEQARAMLRRAAELTERMKVTPTTPDDPRQAEEVDCELYGALASVALQLGDPDEAWTCARHSYQMANVIGEPLLIGFANRAMGEALTAVINLAQAPDATALMIAPPLSSDPDDYFRASSDAFQAIKADGEVARTMYAHARSLQVRGRGMMAARKLQQAMIIFTRLGMADDAAKAARAQMDVLAVNK